ncbi:MAG: ABC transporter ATP-binding protein [Clostridia bacterium]|nr:ABC transporter ATP-binding protein [Clostridia bacterium]
MISIKNVSKSYVKGKKAVDGLDLEIKNGEIFGFLGPNGAGKSTTIKMITGILEPTEGEIKIDDYDIKKDPELAKQEYGYVPDNPEIFPKLKGIEYLNFLADIYKVENREEKIMNLVKRFGLSEYLNSQMDTYSHGTKQKIILVGALLHDPKNWILDEPMTGLDPKAAHELKELMIEHAKKGNTVFFSTHVLEVAEKLCDRVGIINNGKLIFVGSYEEVAKNESLEDLFLELTEKKEEE